jgi:hypothetical protein
VSREKNRDFCHNKALEIKSSENEVSREKDRKGSGGHASIEEGRLRIGHTRMHGFL